jgi:phosphate transport system permease protein
MTGPPAAAAHDALAPPRLEKSLLAPRTLFSALLSVLTGLLALLAVLPLISVLLVLLLRGGSRLGLALLTELPPAAGMSGGGVGNALVGTALVVALATLLSVPVGVFAGVFLVEYGPETRTARVVRFAARLLTGLPSILAGVFAYVTVVLTMERFSVVAGGVALALLMLPTVLLTTEAALRSVPERMRAAAVALGATPSQATWLVVVPTALPGILTGALLAVARAAGETAPLLFTVLFSDYWLSRRLLEPTASMTVLVYEFSTSPFENQLEIAWAASLVLVSLILALNLLGQVLTRHSKY